MDRLSADMREVK